MLPLRQILLGTGLVVTLAASYFDFPGLEVEPDTVQSTEPVPGVQAPVASAEATETSIRPRFESGRATLFAAHSWQPPPPPPPKAQLPLAPALPFRYLGKAQEDGQVTVFLAQNARTHMLKKGDTLSGYRVEDITMAEMTFVYLPLNEKQKLIFGSTN